LGKKFSKKAHAIVFFTFLILTSLFKGVVFSENQAGSKIDAKVLPSDRGAGD
jgi:hypothetical protein